jgi:POT family proton-dependent oligopeptide transporter
VSIAFFGWLAAKGKEPKAPVKIGLGMLVAAGAYLLMLAGSVGLPLPNHPFHVADVTPNLLVSTYFILTIAELLLSPIGISFVTKVSPEKYKGMMMGGWFVATALGNMLVGIPGMMWGVPLVYVWGTLTGICLLASLFIFSIIRKLNKVS